MIFGKHLTVSERIGLVTVATIFGAIAYWIYWIVQTFLDGRGWGDFVVRMLLHELVFVIGLFAVSLAAYAVFSTPWLDDWVAYFAHKLHSTSVILLVLFALVVAFALVGLPMLLHLGVLK
jgi:hypothetical protein